MTISLVLVIAMAVLFASGVYLLLERSLTRMLLGFLLLGNAVNLLLLIMTGAAGRPPIGDDPAGMTDPLPQAFGLTAIVITFAVSAFLLALIYRSWNLSRRDEVDLDEEDVAIGRLRPDDDDADDVDADDDADGDDADGGPADAAGDDDADRTVGEARR
ncbi:Na(+)/H(+) antiporter subunit C [Curtobacterium sp. Leaf261]|uniref:Na(+)/H(+) antiporter subunit C n=1 Tax=Curtobacterium sp. Leaf261 TaxID=1736311 RepID=UPI000700961F|nr:Na(+)/H(+) antiporter subunit C [Curtobacterium sp. Leaf261]KQO64762.1 sodium:proton antiporter [Curtobacterium sp. Leaf261]